MVNASTYSDSLSTRSVDDMDDSRTEKEKIEAVVNAYQEARVLWFKGHPEHKSQDTRNTAWIEVARRANLSGK